MSRSHHRIMWIVAGIVLSFAPLLNAQDSATGVEPQYQPTTHGLRMTPRLARAISQAFMRGMGRELNLTDQQVDQIAEAMTRESMLIAHRYQREGRDFAEFMMATMPKYERKKFDAVSGQHFALNTKPIIPATRHYVDALERTGKTVMTPEQHATFMSKINEMRQGIDRFEHRMDRWENGEVGEDEDPFDDDDSHSATQPEQNPRNEKLKQAEWQAQWYMRNVGPQKWEDMTEQVASHFRFDEAQSAEAKRLLAEAEKQVREVMPEDWYSKGLDNRKLHILLGDWDETPKNAAPYTHRLGQAFKAIVEPLKPIEERFYGELFALVTDEQCEQMTERLQAHADKHGAEFIPDLKALFPKPVASAESTDTTDTQTAAPDKTSEE